MKKLLLLMRRDRLEFLGINRMLHTPGARGRAVAKLVLFGFLGLFILAAVTFYCALLGMGLRALNLLSVYPILIAAVVCVVCFVTTVAKAPDVLFSMRDFDTILSLPIPARTVAAASVMQLYNYNLLFSLMIALPGGGVYAYFAHPGWSFYPIYLLLTFALPILPSVLAALVGAVVSVVGASFKKSRYASLILLFLMVLAFMVLPTVVFSNLSMDMAALFNLANTVADAIARIYPLANLFGAAISGSLPALALFLGVSLALFLLAAALFGRYFVRFNSFVNARRARENFQAEDLARQKSVPAGRALLAREFRRYFACNIYVFNTAFGLILSLLFVVALLFMGLDRVMALLEIFGARAMILAMVPFILSFLSGTVAVTASSISLEGKSLWILKSLPVRAMDILSAKLRMNLILLLPFLLIDGVLLSVSLGLSGLPLVLVFLTPTVYGVLTALVGLMGNLKWHRFDWKNETQIVKQSFSAMLPVLVTMALSLPFAYLVTRVPALDYALLPLTATVTVGLADLILYLILRKNAEKWMTKL